MQTAAARVELTGFALLAHVMGMAARDQGGTALENPFEEEPDCADAWLDGWMRTDGPMARALDPAFA